MKRVLAVLLAVLAGMGGMGVMRLVVPAHTEAALREALGAAKAAAVMSDAGAFLVGLLAALAMAWVGLDVRGTAAKWTVGVMTAVLFVTGSLVLALYGVVFSPLMPVAACLSALAAGWGLSGLGPLGHRLAVEAAFGEALSGRQLRRVESAGPRVLLPRKLRAAALVFAPANQGELMRLLEPERFAALQQEYFRLVVQYLREAGAALECVSGGQVRALFGAPLEEKNPALAAVRAGLELAGRLRKLHLDAGEHFEHLLEGHIGIATGELVCGCFVPAGGVRRWAAAGPALEAGVRLAQAAAKYGCPILVCAETMKQAGEEIEARPIDVAAVSGGGTLEVFEPLALSGRLTAERKKSRDRFAEGLKHEREGRWDEAVAEFSAARVKGLPDAAVEFHLRRIEALRKLPQEARGGEAASVELFPLNALL